MNIDIIIGVAFVGTVVLSALIVWSIGETRRHNQKERLKRSPKFRPPAKKEE